MNSNGFSYAAHHTDTLKVHREENPMECTPMVLHCTEFSLSLEVMNFIGCCTDLYFLVYPLLCCTILHGTLSIDILYIEEKGVILVLYYRTPYLCIVAPPRRLPAGK